MPPAAPESNTAETTGTGAVPEKTGGPEQKRFNSYLVRARLGIDAIGMELPVLQELSDEALKTAPCLYTGPAAPDIPGNIVPVGHNYPTSAQFSRPDELESGDAVQTKAQDGETYA